MKRIAIEEYRGWEITFSPEKDTFLAYSNDWDEAQEKKSLTATRKYIDDFLKENREFKPVWVEKLHTTYLNDKAKIKIVGIRKDKRFVYEGKDGKMEQLSDYDLKDYYLLNPDNQKYYDEIKVLEKEIEVLEKKIKNIEDKKVIKEDEGLLKLKLKYSV